MFMMTQMIEVHTPNILVMECKNVGLGSYPRSHNAAEKQR